MKHHNPFQHLSDRLSEKEKKMFLQKVEPHLVQYSKKGKPRREAPSAKGPTQRESTEVANELTLLKRELQKVSGLRRISLSILAYLRSKSLEDTFRDAKLEELRKGLLIGHHHLLVGRGNAISPRFALLLHPIYLKVKLLYRLIQYIWSNETVFTKYYQWCIQQKYAGQIKHQIKDFVNEDDIKDGILTSEKAEELKRKTAQQINRYADGLTPSIIENIQQNLLPLHRLKALFQFPFRDFFHMFGCDNPDIPTAPKFSPCPNEACTRELMQLNSVGQHLKGLVLDQQSITEVVYIALSSTSSSSGKTEEQLQHESQQAFAKLKECLGQWQQFFEDVPLLRLIAFSQRNPYFSHSSKPSPFNVRPAFNRTLTTHLQHQLKELWQRVSRQVVQATERKFVTEMEGTKLTFYSEGSSVDPGKFGQLTFKYFRNLGLIHNFLLRYYPKQLRPVIANLAKAVPKRIPLHQRLLTLANGYENISRQLKAFDSSLAPETERGKRLSNIIYRLEKGDFNARVPLGELIQATDEEAHYLLEKFLSNLQAGHKVFRDVSRNDSEPVQQHLQSLAPHQGQVKKVAELVTDIAIAQQEFFNLLTHRDAGSTS